LKKFQRIGLIRGPKEQPGGFEEALLFAPTSCYLNLIRKDTKGVRWALRFAMFFLNTYILEMN